MKRLLAVLLCMPCVAHAQNDLFGSSAITSSTGFRDARDISGKAIPSGSQGAIEGNPMLFDVFVNGVVQLKGNEAQYNLMVNFSLFENQLYFKKDNETLGFASPVNKFSLITKDNDATRIMNFKNGYPSIGSNDENSFYQILLDGARVQLVKYLYKTVREKYSYGGPVQREYVAKDKLFIYDNTTKSITEVVPSVNSVEKALPNYAAAIEKYASQNKIKHEEDLIALITGINNEPTKKELKNKN